MNPTSHLTKIGLVGAGLVAGAVLAGTIGAQAATPSPTPSAGTSSKTEDAHPGDNGADGIPEAQEHHGGHEGHGLDLAGTVTAVGSDTVTIKTATATTVYSVISSSDIDKNGEATLAALAVGDAVRFSVDDTNATQIDKLHVGDETKNMPSETSTTAPSGSTSPSA